MNNERLSPDRNAPTACFYTLRHSLAPRLLYIVYIRAAIFIATYNFPCVYISSTKAAVLFWLRDDPGSQSLPRPTTNTTPSANQYSFLSWALYLKPLEYIHFILVIRTEIEKLDMRWKYSSDFFTLVVLRKVAFLSFNALNVEDIDKYRKASYALEIFKLLFHTRPAEKWLFYFLTR